eukprot:TRINITY_DN4645_c0_g1_i2.p1 TRINITY_DN4645_c0_g1~~TRINITY_DN4645_c0_g1_i2.p1  ORF type:complete len:313 (+),score=103.59 TRINITY_DN4645_c0_g1_i2:96-1034(+)
MSIGFSLKSSQPKTGFGLQKPKPTPVVKSKLFADDEEVQKEEVKDIRQLMYEDSLKKQNAKEVKQQQQQALEEDPTIFDYDGIHDALKRKSTSEKQARADQKAAERATPKYIPQLITTAKIREQHQDIVYNRVERKKLEKEEQEFGELSQFITPAYKDKLLKDEAFLKQQNAKDAEDEVEKKDMSVFWSGLMTKNVAMGSGMTDEERMQQEQKEEQERQQEEQKLREKLEERRKMEDKMREEEAAVQAAWEIERAEIERKKAEKAEADRIEKEEKEKQRQAKRNTDETISDAKARYLARKAKLTELQSRKEE